MTLAEITDRLRWHAGLGNAPESSGSLSVADCTSGESGSGGGINEAVADVLVELARLNQELNGPAPSESFSSSTDIPRDAAYAVAEMSRMLRESAESTSAGQDESRMSDAAWVIETAWLAVLAGDIDNLQQHVDEERASRGEDHT